MRDLEVAWLAGLYEGEGSCNITSGRAIRIEIAMTDEDIINRIHSLTGVGSVKTAPKRKANYKQVYRWSIGGIAAVNLLQQMMPWLGDRRRIHAENAINNWRTNKSQAARGDDSCIHGHLYSAPGNRRTKYGTCHLCNLEASKRYREKIR